MRNLFLFLALIACLAGIGCGGASYDSYGGMPASPPMHAEPAMEPPADNDGDAIADMSDKDLEEMRLTRGDAGGEAERDELAKEAPPPPPAPPSSKSGQAGGKQEQPPGQPVSVRAPMLIYTAQIAMAVFEVNESLSKVETLARELGGFLAKRDDRTITIRVPVARFDEAVQRLESVGDMLHRNVAVEDVTEQFLDLEIRMRNARAVRERLEKLLEKAATVEESVLLEKELGRVAGEIERLEGRMKYLRDRAAFSTITVSFQPRPRESIDPSGPKLPVSWLNELGLSRLLNL